MLFSVALEYGIRTIQKNQERWYWMCEFTGGGGLS
jgi:hypothetical protein